MLVDVDFIEFNSWEDFDIIANVLVNDLKFKIVQRLEGPDSRVFGFSDKGFFQRNFMSDKGFHFWLVHDDMTGNLLRTNDSKDLEKLRETVQKVNNILNTTKK